MSFRGILLYSLRAGGFAAVICAAYALICRLRGKAVGWKRLLAVAYIAALVQITVLRGGVDWPRVFAGGREARLIPFATMAMLLGGGAWNLIYNVAGNLIWFVPLGFILCGRRGWQVLLCGAALSACIELSQYLLMTGVTDIDDVILNALGAWLGREICRIITKKKCG